LLNESLKIENN